MTKNTHQIATTSIPRNPRIVRELVAEIPAWTFGCDPGETVGVSVVGTHGGKPVGDGERYDSRWNPMTLEPERALDYFAQFCLQAQRAGATPTLYIEEYRIYPEKLAMHSGKTIPTAENIGAFKYIARRMKCRVVEQPANIKVTTASILRARGIPLIGGSRHAKDAELHMWYPVLSRKYKAPTGGKRKS